MTKQKTPGIVKLTGNQYEIRARATCPRTGKAKEVRRAHECSGIKEARAIQIEMCRELQDKLDQEESPEAPRLRDFAGSWLAGREGLIKKTTARKIAMVFDEHIAPSTIADIRIDKIRTSDVEEWISTMRTKQTIWGHGRLETRKTVSEKSKPRCLSAGTIKGYSRILFQILKVATARAGVRNPVEGVEKIKAGKKRKNFLEKDEVVGVLAHVRENAAEWYPAVLLDVFSGLRWGELSALRWDDIDESERMIRVVRNNDKGTMVGSTKTGQDEDSPKIVPLLPYVAEALRERRKAMVASQHPGLKEGWVFPTKLGELHKGSPLRDVLDAACLACGTKRRITPHGLRHTANDLLRRFADGEVVRAIIGHSTEQMTSHYSHVDEGEKHAAATAVFDAVLGGRRVLERVEGLPTGSLINSPKAENPAIAGS
jgi:integrase